MIRVRLEGHTNSEFSVTRADVARRDPAGETVIGAMISRWSGDDAGDKTIDLNPGAALGDKWDEAVAPAIKAWYEHVDGALELPGAELELEYVLCAFAFFGLRVDPASVELIDASAAAKVRATVYVKAMEAIPKAVAYILHKFEVDPSLAKSFVEYESTDNITDMIKAHGSQLQHIGKKAFQATGPETELYGTPHEHKNWMADNFFQKHAVDALKDQGFVAKWQQGYLQTRGPEEYGAGGDERIVHNHRWMCKVTVPSAAESVKKHREKRQRTG